MKSLNSVTVRYLAIVQRKRFLGQQELQLLAKELGEYSWSAAQGEISSELVGRFSPGTLVIADVSTNNQIQRIEDAADHLVALLQSFSRFSESFKAQVEEIESWKQSLIYQSQELSRREAELLVRAQELEMQLTQVGGIDPDEMSAIREAAEGDHSFSPSAISTEQEWLRQREQSVESMETQLTDRQRELDQQLERLRAQQADLQLEREALQHQWEQQSATSSSSSISEAQLAQIQTYLQSLYHLADTNEDGELAEAKLAWQQDWQAFTDTLTEISHQAATLEQRQKQFDEEWQEFRVREAELQTISSGLEQEWAQYHCQQVLVDALLAEQESAALRKTSAQTVPVDRENVERLQRQLREEQREYQQRASLVLQQEEELHSQETHMQELRHRLLTSNGSLSADERADMEEELEFEEQGCLILRDSLSQQQQRLQVEQEKIDQQITRLRSLVGSFDGSEDNNLNRLHEALRAYRMNLNRRQENLEKDRQALSRLEAELIQARTTLAQLRSAFEQHEAESQMRNSALQGQQIELERRQSALEAQHHGQSQAKPLIQDLEFLLRSLQTG
ncbi:MAG: hypothetical protein H7Y37_17915 [Anaerolineae bacterium]|nr:hypothetical protein [Gloeobacterales cyanobacterium ES-bin-313]